MNNKFSENKHKKTINIIAVPSADENCVVSEIIEMASPFQTLVLDLIYLQNARL